MRGALLTRKLSISSILCDDSVLSDFFTFLEDDKNVNFANPNTSADSKYVLREENLTICENAVSSNPKSSRAFDGFNRCEEVFHISSSVSIRRKVCGTRNYVALISLTGMSAAITRDLGCRLSSAFPSTDSFDGVCCVAHTEGESDVQNNKQLILNTLTGWVFHPNVAAVVIVHTGTELWLDKPLFESHLEENSTHFGSHSSESTALEARSIRWVTPEDSHEVVRQVLDEAVNVAKKSRRSPVSSSNIKIALQCGGSDAFSGVTGNVLAGEAARRLIEDFGASANIAESPELIGAEDYMLERVASVDVAREFCKRLDEYKAFAQLHDQDAAGNPSGGNLLRGLYNIVLKSIGAARKKAPSVTVDGVLEYATPMHGKEGNFFFMDSPGNDLESIAGQVASGCTVIYFITGNGALTNFPFVPTLKFVTTTARFEALRDEMDVNAGLLIGGASAPDLPSDVVNRTLEVCSGARTLGELRGHAQTSIWRNWFRTEETQENPHEERRTLPPPSGSPFALNSKDVSSAKATSQLGGVGIIIPTSICSSTIGSILAAEANSDRALGLRWLSPQHTEGCAAAGGVEYEENFARLMVGCATHPLVSMCVFVEHGCEKTHNDYFRAFMAKSNISNISERFTFFSLQQDGGMEGVRNQLRALLGTTSASLPNLKPRELSNRTPRIGIIPQRRVRSRADVSKSCADLILSAAETRGWQPIIPSCWLLTESTFCTRVFAEGPPTNSGWPRSASLEFAALHVESDATGIHIMKSDPSMSEIEVISGMSVLCDAIVVVGDDSRQLVSSRGSVLVPTVRLDLRRLKDMNQSLNDISGALADPSGEVFFKNSDFCVPRCETGISL